MKSKKDDKKKDKERCHLECFQRNYSDFPTGVIDPNHTDAPDFIFKTEHGSLGIELTTYPHGAAGSAQRKQESEWDKAVHRAGMRYASGGGPPLYVNTIWNHHYTITPHRRKELEVELSDLVIRHMPKQDAHTMVARCGGPTLPAEIHSIQIARFNVVTRNAWVASKAGYARLIQIQEIEDILKAKEVKLINYRKHLYQVWLAIIIEGTAPSSFAELDNRVAEYVFNTGFDGVFVVFSFEGRVHPLKTHS